jgi:hypothetical protein
MNMGSFDLVTLAIAVLAVGGLAAVLVELLAKDPRGLIEMVSDSRSFAEAPLANTTAPERRRPNGAALPAANLPAANLRPHVA